MQQVAIKHVKSIGGKEIKMAAAKKPKKNPTFGNGDRRKATGQCRSTAQKNASNAKKKK